MSRTTFLLAILATAVVSAGAALLVGRQLEPASTGADAAAPEPSRITVPVERRRLTTNVVTRGTIEFSDSRSLRVQLGGDGDPVVTGAPAEVGTELAEGDTLVEIGYRPVLVLEGELPMFRDLQPGSEGEDVEQLEEAMVRLGFDPGDVDGVYDSSTEAAISEWYRQLGVDAPDLSRDEKDALRRAEDDVEQAEDQLESARTALTNAKTGPSRAERLQLQLGVDEASAALKTAKSEGLPRLDIRRAEASLVEAQESQSRALRLDSSAEAKGFLASEEALARSKSELAEIQRTYGLRLPRTEIAFVPSLPRRIEAVNVKKGDVISDPAVVSVSSANVRLTANVAAADRPLISEGDTVLIADSGVGLETEGTISFIADSAGGQAPDGKYTVRITPNDDTAAEYQGLSVKITVPVEATDGDVLAVPAAALSATVDGSARVEVELEDDTTRIVTVEAGLSSNGYVEVKPIGSELDEGDRVVIGIEDGSIPVADQDESAGSS